MSSIDGRELRFLRLEDVVVLVAAGDRHVGRDLDDVEVVDLDELLLLGLRGTGHAGELLVEAEVVLERDRGERHVLLLDPDALLRLDRLVEAVAPAPPLHDPARELVDDLDLAVLDHVVDVALVERLGLQRLDQVVDELDVPRVVEVLDPERALDRVDRGLRRRDGLVLLVVEVVGAGELGLVLALLALSRRRRAGQLLDDAREVVVGRRGRLGLAGDDQRRPRLVDQDRVDLVHDREGVAALDEPFLRDGHVVAQIVEAELGVRAVGDVGGVRLAPLGERHHVLDEADGHAEALEDGAVPLGVALGEVVVDRDEVDAGAGEPVQVERESRRRTSCPHRSSSRRCRPRAGRCRPSSGRRTSAAATRASAPRARPRRPRRAARRATPRSRAAGAARRSCPGAPRRRASGSPARARRCSPPAGRAASCAGPRRGEGPSRASQNLRLAST